MLSSIYQVEKHEKISGTTDEYSLSLNEDHPIFKGHFPGFPVLPGVVQIGMVTELLEQKIGKKLLLVKASNTKFLKMIDPVKMASIKLSTNILEETTAFIRISSSISADEGACLKFKANYKFA